MEMEMEINIDWVEEYVDVKLGFDDSNMGDFRIFGLFKKLTYYKPTEELKQTLVEKPFTSKNLSSKTRCLRIKFKQGEGFLNLYRNHGEYKLQVLLRISFSHLKVYFNKCISVVRVIDSATANMIKESLDKILTQKLTCIKIKDSVMIGETNYTSQMYCYE